MSARNVIVVGGGASGLTAAIAAARGGAAVSLIERMDRVGKKILATGNGRCNLTNEAMAPANFYGEDTSIVKAALEQFGFQETLGFFGDLGVLFKNRNGYYYPITDQASTILDVLRMELERLDVRTVCGEAVTEAVKEAGAEDRKAGRTFRVRTDRGVYRSDALVLAAGGKASSHLGSDGSGYALAEAFGHTVSPVVPALVALTVKDGVLRSAAGVRIDAAVTILADEKRIAADSGELQITDQGISGIPVFQISRFAAKALREKKKTSVSINFLPSMPDAAFRAYMEKRRASSGHKTAETFLIGMLHKKVAGILLKSAGISPRDALARISEAKWEALLGRIRSFPAEIKGTRPFEQAQVCAGGVRTREVDHMTMESALVPGLYLAGELLDIDGICGGYNLQWAWTSGYLAGKNAAEGRLS